MALPPIFDTLRIPVFGAPLFIIQNPKLVIAQCKAGVVGCFPALNAREAEGEPPLLDAWLTEIKEELDRHNQANPDNPAAPYAVNQIVHRSNGRLQRDMEICVKHEVPIYVTSLGAREEIYEAAHSYGGIALHDVINNTFAKKATSSWTTRSPSSFPNSAACRSWPSKAPSPVPVSQSTSMRCVHASVREWTPRGDRCWWT